MAQTWMTTEKKRQWSRALELEVDISGNTECHLVHAAAA